MTSDRMVAAAARLQQLGVSQAGVIQLLSQYAVEEIEAQLDWLPYRKAKRPGAFIVEAIRCRYSPPKELFYAPTQKPPAITQPLMDQDPEPAAGYPDAEPPGHGTEGDAGDPASHLGLEPSGGLYHLAIPKTLTEDRKGNGGDIQSAGEP